MAKIDELWDDVFSDLNKFSDALFKTTKTAKIASPFGVMRNYKAETTPEALVVTVEMPGVKPADVEVSAWDRLLVIEYVRNKGKTTQRLTIREDYDALRATAKLEHGVLELRVPKADKPLGEKVTIEVK